MLKVDTKEMGKLLNSFQAHPYPSMQRDRVAVFTADKNMLTFLQCSQQSNFSQFHSKMVLKGPGGSS